MIRDALIIFKKELKNLVKDRRTLLSTFLLPLLVLPIIVLGFGTVLDTMQRDAQESVYQLSLQGIQDPTFVRILEDRLHYKLTSDQQEADVVIQFPPSYVPGMSSRVQIIFDSSSQKRQFAAREVHAAIDAYDRTLGERLLTSYGLSYDDLQTIQVHYVDLAPEAAQSGGFMLAMMVPYFLVIFLFAGSMNAGLDTTSGEKERGSLAALLVNQVSRSSIAWGKILYVMTVACSSAIATFIGLLLAISLPNGSAFFGGGSVQVDLFGGLSLFYLVINLIITALFCASCVTVLGSLAKTVKEGTSYVMPLYMIVVLVGVTTMYMDPTQNGFLFLIPIVNTIFSMKEIFMGMALPLHIIITVISNLIYAGLCAIVVSKLFNSERILQTV